MTLSELPGWLLLLAYASIAIEMLVVAVPSEASTYQLLKGDAVTPAAGRLQIARARSRTARVMCFLLPTALGVALFLAPLAVVLWPPLWAWSLAVTGGPSAPAVWVGLSFVLAGRLLTTGAALQLRRRSRLGKTIPLTGGVFRFSRNPILVGMYLFYAGNCIWLPSPLLWAGFVPYALNMHQRVLMEEEFLEARLGREYRDYRARVPRYVGWPARAAKVR